MCGSIGGIGDPDSPEKSKKIKGLFSNTGRDLIKNHKASKHSILGHSRPATKHHLNGVSLAG